MTGGTQITIASRDGADNSVVSDCQFKVSALTTTGVVYEGAKWGRNGTTLTNGAATPIFVYIDPEGIALQRGWGLAMRLEYAAVVGMFVDLNVHWVEVA